MLEQTRRSRSPFLSSLRLQADVVGAVIMREMSSRFGRDNIGYLWLVGEPMMFASAISILHTYFRSAHINSDIGAFPFTLIGYTLFIILRYVVNRSESMVESGMPLLYHRMISIFDIVLARTLFEVMGCFGAFLVLCTVAIVVGLAYVPPRPLNILMAFGWMAWLCFGISLIVSSIAFDRPFVQRLIGPMTYFAIPLSGAFYTMSFLPANAREIMKWNPMMTIFEHARYGMFWSASDKYLYPGYITSVCAALTYCGLIMVRRVRKRVHFG